MVTGPDGNIWQFYTIVLRSGGRRIGMDRVIVGQKHLVDSLLIGLLSDGHILLEGVPGLAKTLAIKTLAQ